VGQTENQIKAGNEHGMPSNLESNWLKMHNRSPSVPQSRSNNKKGRRGSADARPEKGGKRAWGGETKDTRAGEPFFEIEEVGKKERGPHQARVKP